MLTSVCVLHSIEKITGLKGLDALEVLSLGRNCIKKLEGEREDETKTQTRQRQRQCVCVCLCGCACGLFIHTYIHMSGLDDVAATMKELWISYNLIDKVQILERQASYQICYVN
jgi:hypothetical protein